MRVKNGGISKSLGSGKWANGDYWKYTAKTDNQRAYVQSLVDKDVSVVLGLGPAGSGKTLLACNAAISALKMEECERIVLTRPIIPVDDEELGFLPGSIVQKMDPWTRPIFDIFEEFYSKTQLAGMIKSGVIEISPLAFMRGRTFKKAFILADEMQNSSPNQMLMMLTRVGEGSKIVLTGDLRQSDRSDKNGLQDFIERFTISDRKKSIKLVELNSDDVMRSAVVRDVLSIYNKDTVLKKESLCKEIYKTSSINDDSALMPIEHIPRTIK